MHQQTDYIYYRHVSYSKSLRMPYSSTLREEFLATGHLSEPLTGHIVAKLLRNPLNLSGSADKLSVDELLATYEKEVNSQLRYIITNVWERR